MILLPSAGQARARFSWEEHQVIDKKWPKAIETSTGLLYVVTHQGKGPTPQPGDKVSVLYKGMLFDGTEFDEALDPKEPFRFRYDRGEVIDGWDEAIGTMKVGESRILIVPGDLAYGARGHPPSIPRNAGLIFEVTLIKIEPVE